MPITTTPFPGPATPINPDIAERIAELTQDNEKDGFINLGPGNNSFEYNGTSYFDPFQHKIYTLHFGQKINGGAGADGIRTSSGDDIVHGGSGRDVINTEAGNDQIYGGSDDDFITGGLGDDTISGGSGNDLLLGDALFIAGGGNDTISGGSGNDRIIGMEGYDRLTGGSGADTFVYAEIGDARTAQGGNEQILDFNRFQGDRIDLRSLFDDGTNAYVANGVMPGEGRVSILQLDATHDRVYINVDGYADMRFDVTLAGGSPHLTAADFLL